MRIESTLTVSNPSTISASPSLSSSSAISLLQGLLKTQGWDDEIGSKISAASIAQSEQEYDLRAAIDAYLEDPTNESVRAKAITALQTAEETAQDEYDYAIAQQTHYQKLVSAESQHTQGWGEWLWSFVSETNADQVKKYQEIANQRQNTLRQISESISALEAAAAAQTPVTGQFPKTVSLSSMPSGSSVKITGRATDVATGWGLSGSDGVDVFGDNMTTPAVLVTSRDAQSQIHGFVIPGGTNIGQKSSISLDNSTSGIVRIDGTVPSQLTSDLTNSIAVGNVLPNSAPAILMDAPNQNTNTGVTYVVPAGDKLGTGPVSLGSSGVIQMTGEAQQDLSGYGLDSGDIDGDGQPEAFTTGLRHTVNGISNVGRVYAAKPGAKNPLPLGDSTVIKFDGDSTTTPPAYTGYSTSVTHKHDINGDGIADVVTTTYDGSRAYVVFGGTSVNSSQPISLAKPSAGQGVVVQGKPAAGSGFASVTTGDVNGDGFDDVILNTPSEGIVSVVYGSSNLTTPLDRTTLNSKNGFVIKGLSGSGAGPHSIASTDVDGDGIDDIIVGSPHQTSTPTTFVVFGSSNISATVDLTTLDGRTGFTITGRSATDLSGAVVSSAGDFNKDGVSDIVTSSPGISTVDVIFGDTVPVLHNYSFPLAQSAKTTITSTMLGATSENHDDSDILFTITGVTPDLSFSRRDDTTVTSFSQAEVKAGNISIAQDGTTGQSGFSVGVTTSGLAYVPPVKADVSVQVLPVITVNSLVIRQGEQVKITSQNISAYEPGQNISLTYIVSNVQHGQFLVSSTAKTSFTDSQITKGAVEFAHDGGYDAPAYDLVVTDGTTSTQPQAGLITFTALPYLGNVFFKVSPPDHFTVTSSNLYAEDPSVDASQLVYQISGITHCYFTLLGSDLSVTNFTQQDVAAGRVLFHADDDYTWPGDKPAFKVSVSAEGFECKDCPVDADVEIDGLPQGEKLLMGIGGAAILGITLLYLYCRRPKTASEDVADTLYSHFHPLLRFLPHFLRSDCCGTYNELATTIVGGINLVSSVPLAEIKARGSLGSDTDYQFNLMETKEKDDKDDKDDQVRLIDPESSNPSSADTTKVIGSKLSKKPSKQHDKDSQDPETPLMGMGLNAESPGQSIPLSFAWPGATPDQRDRFLKVVKAQASAILQPNARGSCCYTLFHPAPKIRSTGVLSTAHKIRQGIFTAGTGEYVPPPVAPIAHRFG